MQRIVSAAYDQKIFSFHFVVSSANAPGLTQSVAGGGRPKTRGGSLLPATSSRLDMRAIRPSARGSIAAYLRAD
jgi:hypothetical protein